MGEFTVIRTPAFDLLAAEYRASPLEVMAYTLESVFRNSQTPFDAATIVREQLHAIYS